SGSEDFDHQALFSIERQPLLSRFVWPHWLVSVQYLIKQNKKYDQVLVSHVLPLGSAAWLAKFITGRDYLVIVHGMDIGLLKNSFLKKWLAKKVLKKAKVVVTNSKALEEEVKNDFGISQTVVVYPCLKQLDQPEKIDHGQINLLTVARLVSRKGHARVLEALKLLQDRHQLGQTKYIIVGNGPIYQTLVNQIKHLGLENAVEIKQDLSDQELGQVYAKTDVFVMPTVDNFDDREGFGMVYLEAAQHGIPSIATYQKGVDEAVLDGQTGILVKDGQIDELARAINKLILDQESRHSLGQAAQERVNKEFNCQTQFSKLKPFL
ncbi:glycosyltransferase family 4 protein, partial [Patescibacteria group bacterium]